MLIEIIDVSAEIAVKTYHTIEVAYKSEGKTAGKKLMSFLNTEVYNTLLDATRGEVYDVACIKNDKGYWDWVGIAKLDPAQLADRPSAVAAPVRDFKKESTAVKSNYETAEERAARQILIVRQSSISSAIASCGQGGVDLSVDFILERAKQFEDYVFGGSPRQVAEAAVANIESDVI